MKMHWYVINVKPKSEKKVSAALNRKKIENYFPVNEIVKDFSFDRKSIQKPFFDAYNFVFAPESELSIVKSIPDVVSIVYWLGKPVIVTDAEINMLKRFLNDHINIKAERVSLQIHGKNFNNTLVSQETGSVIKMNKTVSIVLPSLGYKLTAEAPTTHVKLIPSGNFTNLSKPRTSKLFNIVNIFNNF